MTNSGTEANELALMMARLYTGCHDVVSVRNGYHGNASGTMAATSQSSYKFNVVQVFLRGTILILLLCYGDNVGIMSRCTAFIDYIKLQLFDFVLMFCKCGLRR